MNGRSAASPYLRKVFLLVLVPFAAFLLYAGYSIFQTWRSIGLAERVLQQADLVERTFHVIRELQRERSFSAQYLTGTLSLQELEKQYSNIQPPLEVFLAGITNASLSQSLREECRLLQSKLFDIRKGAVARETFTIAYQQYTRLIGMLQDVQKSMAQAFQDAETAKLFNNIILLEAAREYAGKLRVTFTRLLSSPPGAEDESMYLLLVTHTALRELLNVRALSLTTRSQKLLATKRESENWKFMNNLISHLISGKEELERLNAEPSRFVQAIAEVIHDLEEITAIEDQQVRVTQQRILEQARGQLFQTITLIFLVSIFLMYLGYDYITGLLERASAYTRLHNTLEELSEARKQEINIGWQIQKELLLGKIPTDLSGCRMASRSIPSLGIDGDFLDFFTHDTHTVDVLFGDVMGKGIPAALVGAAAKSHFQRAMSHLLLELQQHAWPRPDEIVALVQKRMSPGLFSVERFISLHYGQFDFSRRILQLVNCGHTEVMHLQRATGSHRLYKPQNAPLGIFETETFKLQTIPFAPGDLFVFYSDGITEARSPSGEFFGKDRLVRIVSETAAHPNFSPEAVVERVMNDLPAFTQSNQFRDDLTILIVEAV